MSTTLRSRLPLTEEQRVIVGESLSLSHGNLRVVAGAGTGKTSTSIEIATPRTQRGGRVLYLAYNAPIRDEAKGKFGRYADVFTVHGIAYRGVGARYLKRRHSSLYPSQIEPLMGVEGKDLPTPRGQLSRLTLQTITSFLYSPDYRIEEHHLPAPVRKSKDTAFKSLVVEAARRVFSRITPDAKTDLPLPHDVYLKYWHLIGAPGLEGYDLVLMDEAQDSNGVTLGALESCPAVIWIGDSHQQIYAFRGAVDAMSRVGGRELPLTQSFRYGEAIAAMANAILARKRNASKFKLRGLATKDSVIDRIHPREPHTRLYRTNVELLRDAMFFLDRGERIAIVGDQSDLRSKVESAWKLKCGERKGIRHPLISMFPTWGALEDYAEEAHDPEVGQVLRVIEQYDGRIQEVLDLIGRQWDEKAARIILTTAHRAKGREWANVVIAPDFDNLLQGERELSVFERDAELNLLYVAVTRATSQLELQSEYAQYIHSQIT
jgi:hypothetical protein